MSGTGKDMNLQMPCWVPAWEILNPGLSADLYLYQRPENQGPHPRGCPWMAGSNPVPGSSRGCQSVVPSAQHHDYPRVVPIPVSDYVLGQLSACQ